jgi:hypothetical protein
MTDKEMMRRVMEALPTMPIRAVVEPTQKKPQREFIGLTEDDIREFEIWLDDEEERRGWNPPEDIAKYLEAKLKEKNT